MMKTCRPKAGRPQFPAETGLREKKLGRVKMDRRREGLCAKMANTNDEEEKDKDVD